MDPWRARTAAAIRRVIGRQPEFVCSPGTYDQKHIDRIGKLRDCIAYGPGISGSGASAGRVCGDRRHGEFGQGHGACRRGVAARHRLICICAFSGPWHWSACDLRRPAWRCMMRGGAATGPGAAAQRVGAALQRRRRSGCSWSRPSWIRRRVPAAAICRMFVRQSCTRGLVQFAARWLGVAEPGRLLGHLGGRDDLCIPPETKRAVPRRQPASTPAAAKFSLDRAIDAKSTECAARAIAPPSARWMHSDPYTLRLSLSRRSGGLLQSLAFGGVRDGVAAVGGRTTPCKPVGTGTVSLLANWRRGDSLTLLRNPGFFVARSPRSRR